MNTVCLLFWPDLVLNFERQALPPAATTIAALIAPGG
jgi:hypothetical protein